MKHFLTSLLLVASLLLASCQTIDHTAPEKKDGYMISIYDPQGDEMEEHEVDTYKEVYFPPKIRFKADDGRDIVATDYQVEERTGKEKVARPPGR